MNHKRFFLLVFFLFSPVVSPAASIKILLDTGHAETVILAFEKGSIAPDELDDLARSYAGKNLIKHSAMFDPRATRDQYVQSFTAAIGDMPLADDPFRLDRVSKNLDAIQKVLLAITGNADKFQEDIATIINPYMPRGIAAEVKVYLVVGGNSVGWTDANDEFFLDLNGIRGDVEGATIMAAHEIYHVIQAIIAPEDSYPEGSRFFNVEALLGNAMIEGTANYVADFEYATGNGALVAYNKKLAQTNKRRMYDNFRLLDALIYQAANDSDFDIDSAYRIAYSGLFDEGGYYVGHRMAAVIDRHRGRARLIDLQSRPPVEFFAEYIGISKRSDDEDIIPFGPSTEKIVTRLD